MDRLQFHLDSKWYLAGPFGKFLSTYEILSARRTALSRYRTVSDGGTKL